MYFLVSYLLRAFYSDMFIVTKKAHAKIVYCRVFGEKNIQYCTVSMEFSNF